MILFKCPGCKETHSINDTWTWNGSTAAPTFSPSVLVRGVQLTDKGRAEYEAWCDSDDLKREEPFDHVNTVCHSFVRDGMIQYLDDCTHELRGQTVELPMW
jgi:hypothetical protein